MSETAKFANVVRRGAAFLEKSGTFTHGEHGLPRVNEVISQPDCTPDGVLAEIARFAAPQFGSQKVGGGWNDQRQVPVFGQCAALAPSSRKLVKNHAGHEVYLPAVGALELAADERVVGEFSNGFAVGHGIYVHAFFRQRIVPSDLGDMPQPSRRSDQDHGPRFRQPPTPIVEPGSDLMRMFEFPQRHGMYGSSTRRHLSESFRRRRQSLESPAFLGVQFLARGCECARLVASSGCSSAATPSARRLGPPR